MKRTLLITAPVLTSVILLGLAVAGPDWLPTWARFDSERLPAWARFGSLSPTTAGAVDHGLYYREHGVPEKFCTLCHPEVEQRYDLIMWGSRLGTEKIAR